NIYLTNISVLFSVLISRQLKWCVNQSTDKKQTKISNSRIKPSDKICKTDKTCCETNDSCNDNSQIALFCIHFYETRYKRIKHTDMCVENHSRQNHIHNISKHWRNIMNCL